uniref:Uncharacterized protein n=1 Tax=Ditylenchus dipsaci TaxID=166011 RepID=A0A915CSW9_9BILA
MDYIHRSTFDAFNFVALQILGLFFFVHAVMMGYLYSHNPIRSNYRVLFLFYLSITLGFCFFVGSLSFESNREIFVFVADNLLVLCLLAASFIELQGLSQKWNHRAILACRILSYLVWFLVVVLLNSLFSYPIKPADLVRLGVSVTSILFEYIIAVQRRIIPALVIAPAQSVRIIAWIKSVQKVYWFLVSAFFIGFLVAQAVMVFESWKKPMIPHYDQSAGTDLQAIPLAQQSPVENERVEVAYGKVGTEYNE